MLYLTHLHQYQSAFITEHFRPLLSSLFHALPSLLTPLWTIIASLFTATPLHSKSASLLSDTLGFPSLFCDSAWLCITDEAFHLPASQLLMTFPINHQLTKIACDLYMYSREPEVLDNLAWLLSKENPYTQRCLQYHSLAIGFKLVDHAIDRNSLNATKIVM